MQTDPRFDRPTPLASGEVIKLRGEPIAKRSVDHLLRRLPEGFLQEARVATLCIAQSELFKLRGDVGLRSVALFLWIEVDLTKRVNGRLAKSVGSQR